MLRSNLIAEESIRCNGSLIDLGEFISTVLHKCGEPTDTIEYTVTSSTQQRYVLSSVTNRRILVDEFQLESDMEQPLKDNSEELGETQLRSILTDLSRDNAADFYTYKDRKINRKIYNSDFANTMDLQYVYWESVKKEIKIKKLVYNLGSTQFIRILTFKNGQLWKMTFKEYGY